MFTTSCVIWPMASVAARSSCWVFCCSTPVSASTCRRWSNSLPSATFIRWTNTCAMRSTPSTCACVAARMKLSIERCTGSMARMMLCSICTAIFWLISSTAWRM